MAAPFQCKFCDLAFDSPEGMNGHKCSVMEGHLHECVICRKIFHHRDFLVHHFSLHTGDRIGRCAKCIRMPEPNCPPENAAAASTDKVYSCSLCKKTFKVLISFLTNKILRRNLSSCHLCNICGKVFCQEGCLRQHLQSHPGDHKYHCDKCSGTFTLRRLVRNTHKDSRHKKAKHTM